MEAAHHAGRLNDQVAIVTGAAQGLGLGLATRLVAEGARVVRADITEAVHTAAAVAFLVSPDAAYSTGQTLNVDGGFQPRQRDRSGPNWEQTMEATEPALGS